LDRGSFQKQQDVSKGQICFEELNFSFKKKKFFSKKKQFVLEKTQHTL